MFIMHFRKELCRPEIWDKQTNKQTDRQRFSGPSSTEVENRSKIMVSQLVTQLVSYLHLGKINNYANLH